MNHTASRTDVQASYRSPGTLAARASIYDRRRSTTDFRATVAQHIDVPSGGRVLDIGCGTAPYFPYLATQQPTLMVGLDASIPMLQQARERARDLPSHTGYAQGLLDALPLRPGQWDVVLAAHSLYHAHDPTQVLAHLPELLRPGGDAALYLVLNGPDHLREIRDLARAAGHPGLLQESDRLTTHAAIDILRADYDVTTWWLDDTLVITHPDQVVGYVDSSRTMYEPRLAAPRTWEDMTTQLRHLVADEIARDGHLDATVQSALIRCQ